ncbi:MAG: MATE family efflux transporter [Rhizobiaceae bacterium]|nr:MATE family efflux transporter [Rhizobiaceae bacterium]
MGDDPEIPTKISSTITRSGPVSGGNFVVTHRLVLSIAIPMTIGYLTTPILGLVDTAVIGQLGVAALIGGLAVGTILVDMVFFTFNFLRSGTVGLTAQAYGADDKVETQATLFRALLLALIIGVILMLSAPLFLSVGLHFIAPSEAVAKATKSYFEIRMVSAPFALANYVLFGWLIGCSRANTALFLQILLNGINIGLSIFLGLTLKWGITGVAVATVIAEIVACLAGLVIAWRLIDRETVPTWTQIKNIAAVKRLMSMNGDIMVRSFALLFAFGYFTAQSAGFGDTILAANAVLFHFFFVSGYFLDGLAVAAEQIAGRAVGARDRVAFVRSAKLTIAWSTAMSILLVLVYLAVGEALIDLITTSIEVRETAKEYFLWAALIAIIGVAAFVMDGIYIGSTWSREMSITMVVSLAGFILFWQIAKPYLGNDGLWLAFYGFLILRGLTMSLRLPHNIRKTFG